MLVYACLAAVAIAVIGAIQNLELWGSSPWWQGVLAGYALGVIWPCSRKIGLVVSPMVLGLAFWVGFVPGASLSLQTRALFCGMSMALPLGMVTTLLWNWKSFRTSLVTVARFEGHRWLLRLLGEEVDPK